MVESFTLATFSGRVGEAFEVHVDEGRSFPTTLLAANSLGPYPGAAREPFSLVFASADRVLVPQRIYEIRHTGLGAFELFLVPIGPGRAGMRYEAVFT